MKKGLKVLLVLMMVGIAFFVVSMELRNSFSAMSPRAYMNISKTTQLNLTLILNVTDPHNVTNVTFMFSNMTNRWMYNTTFVNTSNNASNGSFFYNNSFDTSLLADGVYNISVNITNSSQAGLTSFLNESDVTCLGCGYNITIDNTPPNITINLSAAVSGIPVLDGSNFSASKLNVSFNASIFDFRPQQVGDGIYQANLFNISTVRFVFSNGTGSEFNMSSNLTNGSKGIVENRSGVWTVNYNVSSLSEGKNSIRIIVNDTHNNTNATTVINFTVDKSVPNITLNTSTTPAGIPIQDGSNFSASKLNASFNVSAFDNVTGIDFLYFWFDNGTGKDFNITATNVSGVWTVNYNVSSLFEGQQGVRIVANDSANNLNDSFFFNFTIDRTTPVLTIATSSVGSDSAKATATINESVANCTYSSVAGAQGSAGNGNLSVSTAGTLTVYSKTFSSLTAGTGYQIEVTCTDFVGYTVTNGLSWSTTAAAAAASNGGSGSGGAGGGISSGVKGETAKEVWNSINAGETASVKVENGAIGITEVSFSVPATVYGAWVQVSKKDSLPSTVSSFSGKVYKNLEIIKGPALNKEGSFTDAAIEFKVEKAWLAEKQLGKEAVALHRYVNGAWVELSTTVGEDDGTYVHYSAKTPGFSYFVIGEKSGAVAAAPEEAAPAVEAPAEEPAAEAAPAEEAMMEKKGMSKGLLVALLVALAAVVAVVLYLKKRR